MAEQTAGGKYAIVFMDAVHFYVREDNRTVKKAVYVAIGVRLNGTREVPGMWIGGNESAKYRFGILNEVKTSMQYSRRRRYSAASCIRSVLLLNLSPIRT